MIRTWTEAELAGDSVGRQGDDVLAGLTAALTRRLRVPRRSGLDPTIAMLAVMMMVERFNYYAATGQVDATRDELLDTLTGVITAAISG